MVRSDAIPRAATTMSASPPEGPARTEPGAEPVLQHVGEDGRIRRLDRALARAEIALAGTLMLALFVLLLANVVARAAGAPLIWSDELAVYLMAIAAFVGASAGIAERQHIVVTLLSDLLPAKGQALLGLAVDLCLIVFFAVLARMMWVWFDPVGVIRAASIDQFQADTFNFIYQEPTPTIGVPKWIFWLVLPAFTVTGSLHVLAQLSETLARLREAF